MEPNSARPATMRLLSPEIAPRREELLEHTAGNSHLFRQLATYSARAGHCTLVTDASGILVMLDDGAGKAETDDWNGIGVGSCWGENIAGTNGVAMAMLEEQQVTMRGSDHYLSMFSQFTCSATPLVDADNQMIGTLCLAAIDRGYTADYLFARQLLDAAATQIQRNLFERKYRNAEIFSISPQMQRSLLGSSELVAVDETGIILGSTTKAHIPLGLSRQQDLSGKSFELLLGVKFESLHEQHSFVRTSNNVSGSVKLHSQVKSARTSRINQARSNNTKSENQSSVHRTASPSLSELATGCKSMESICSRAETFFHRGLSFLIEGASGTGKSAIITALLNSVDLDEQSAVSIDCASLSDNEDDQNYFKTLLQQARVVDSNSFLGPKAATLIFDNIDELPNYAQAGLRSLLNELENQKPARITEHTLRIIATCKHSLLHSVESNCFRDDLYYLLSKAVIRIPLLKQRENLELFFHELANRVAGHDVEFTTEAVNALRGYDWPGNVRQLHNVLQQALLEGNFKRISLIDLSSTVVCTTSAALLTPQHVEPGTAINLVYDEKTQLLDALLGANWNISQAARTLGIARATINRKMKRYGVKRPEDRQAN
ncbi:hypothetical protein AB833_10910 [Chromatiales bacterium (ex Bugula neritina AB1)]|nr:hypothetical protein AB833_10910 [Chromatiales bacterium (ex Bugula neritina AB1)]